MSPAFQIVSGLFGMWRPGYVQIGANIIVRQQRLTLHRELRQLRLGASLQFAQCPFCSLQTRSQTLLLIGTADTTAINKDIAPRAFTLRIEGPEGITLVEAGAVHRAAAEEVLTVPITLRAAPGVAKGRVDLDLVVESDAEGVSETEETRFFGPF